jgi:hypothetical protein
MRRSILKSLRVAAVLRRLPAAVHGRGGTGEDRTADPAVRRGRCRANEPIDGVDSGQGGYR